MNRNVSWKITVMLALMVVIVAFTPLVLAPGKINPKIFSMPFTLWVSIALTIVLVLLTYIAGHLLFKKKESETE